MTIEVRRYATRNGVPIIEFLTWTEVEPGTPSHFDVTLPGETERRHLMLVTATMTKLLADTQAIVDDYYDQPLAAGIVELDQAGYAAAVASYGAAIQAEVPPATPIAIYLTQEEITVLKDLAANAGALLALVGA